MDSLEIMLDRRQKIERTLFLMTLAGVSTIHTEYGPVKVSELHSDAEMLDALIIKKLDKLPIDAVLLNIINS